MPVDTSLSEQKMFWKILFEKENMASQLFSLSTNHPNGVLYELPNFGQVRVRTAPASALGDNFMSDTFSVTAHLAPRNPDSTSSTLRTFIKVLPSNSTLRQLAHDSHVHQREINMYHTFFDLLREINPGQLVPLDVPDVYYVHLEEIVKGGSDGSETCILLEDLKDKGYVMSDKLGGADYRHCHLALTSLAHYHALTLTALKKWTDPETGEFSKIPPEAAFILEDTMFGAGSIKMVQDWSKSLVDFAKDINRPDLAEWLSELLTRLDEIMPVETLKNSGPLACILHGDFWNNNMLFKYEEGIDEKGTKTAGVIPVSIKLIDFQISRIGNPLSDILYFLYSSATPETREKHLTELLRHYFDTLMADLKLVGIVIENFSFEDFMADYKKKSLGVFFMGAMVMSVTINKEVVSKIVTKNEEDKEKKPNSTPELGSELEKKNAYGSLDTEEKVKNMMFTTKLSDNPILARRLLTLILDVQALNSS